MRTLVLLTLLGAVLGLAGCPPTTESVAGVYVWERDPQMYLRLREDGTFVLPMGIEGTWELEGDEILFLTPMGLGTGQIEGDTITLSDGEVFHKRGH